MSADRERGRGMKRRVWIAVLGLHRSIDEYNQMVSYPDGLDRERLAQREVVAG